MSSHPRAPGLLRQFLSVASVTLLSTAGVFGQAAGPEPRKFVDKSAYNLFSPTPADMMREMAPDRPDTTESPFTLDAGHYQFELSFGEWRKEGGSEELAILPTNLKIGLTNNADLQLVVNPYLRTQSAGTSDAGHGDTQVRLKVNLWGNDGGDGFFGETALAVMPFIQLPTGADAFSNDDHLEWGVIVPLILPLPAEFSLTVMAEFDWVRDGRGGYDTLFVHTASLSREISGPFAGYIEYVGVQPIDGDGEYQASLGGGLTYQLSDNVLLDCGAEAGLNSAADDLRIFAGMSFRL
ncbi:transporter [Humisphaera borealis]|uniref:Transporter n=1 Tax=Humisphaera borealis TaxID=2807512 RepID=A0A7M2WPQ8_9BACT|nr:transporter [Humisphaera borealis]QOV87505.1 transporter [Humisphaera borealis]